MLLDPAKIEQVLNNLISNAVKFSYPASTVEIGVPREGDRALISVRDEGQGIPADEVDNLFKWFGKTSVKGTGRGEQHGTGPGHCAQNRVGTPRNDLGRKPGRQGLDLLRFTAHSI